MSAEVVTIRGHACRRKRNRREDEDAIRLRRMLAAAEATAFEDMDATALALSWAMARKLPCGQLRLIAGTLDQRRDFDLRLAEVRIACAEREALSAKIDRTRILYGNDAAQEMYADSECAFNNYRQAVADLASTPALTRQDISRKRAAIGSVWLGAEGAWYDRLRAAVAADEDRLATNRQRRA